MLASISSVLAKQSALRKWATFATAHSHAGEPDPLFLTPDGDPLPVFHEPDPVFLHHGLLRGPVELRGMSRAPDPKLPGNLLCRLRALFGVNGRAEIMAWLLTHESGHPAAIARDTGYFSKSVQHTLNEMEGSGHIRSRREGREKIFWIKPTDWNFLVTWSHPTGFPGWIDWMPMFSAITTFVEALGQSGLDEASAQIQSIQLRKALDDAMPAIARAGLASRMISHRGLTGQQLTSAVLEDLEMLGSDLDAAS